MKLICSIQHSDWGNSGDAVVIHGIATTPEAERQILDELKSKKVYFVLSVKFQPDKITTRDILLHDNDQPTIDQIEGWYE